MLSLFRSLSQAVEDQEAADNTMDSYSLVEHTLNSFTNKLNHVDFLVAMGRLVSITRTLHPEIQFNIIKWMESFKKHNSIKSLE